MAVLSKPIPALYTVYILRSTVRHASLYIGSTPHPPRRLKQHNGEVRGGAARTSRDSLRPWEMVAIVSGFPGMVAALKFEWALTNPHLSMHIPSTSRITISTGRKKNGHPRRPRQNLTSILSNVNLLLGVPSFRRWPLKLHFFARDIHSAWQALFANTDDTQPRLTVVTDFGPTSTSTSTATATASAAATSTGPWGIHSLPLDYGPIKGYVEKSQEIVTFEREGRCVVCKDDLQHGQGLYAVCTNDGCDGTGHISCWSQHLLGQDGDGDAILPTQGQCPKCGGEVAWGDMMKELTLRERDQKELVKLLKQRKKKTKA